MSHIQVYSNEAGNMTLALYTMADQPVMHIERRIAAGEKYACDWNLSSVANGVYFAHVKIKYNNGKEDKKVLKIAVLK
jgi:hypothetical protein